MMDAQRAARRQTLVDFLKTIQRPDKQIESVGNDDNLVASGLIDSLAVIQIVLHLESTYGLDFSADGIDPERLASISSILDLIESRQQ